jgi:hypothetical protein
MLKLREFLVCVSFVARESGWVSTRKARDTGATATADVAVVVCEDYGNELGTVGDSGRVASAMAWIDDGAPGATGFASRVASVVDEARTSGIDDSNARMAACVFKACHASGWQLTDSDGATEAIAGPCKGAQADDSDDPPAPPSKPTRKRKPAATKDRGDNVANVLRSALGVPTGPAPQGAVASVGQVRQAASMLASARSAARFVTCEARKVPQTSAVVALVDAAALAALVARGPADDKGRPVLALVVDGAALDQAATAAGYYPAPPAPKVAKAPKRKANKASKPAKSKATKASKPAAKVSKASKAKASKPAASKAPKVAKSKAPKASKPDPTPEAEPAKVDPAAERRAAQKEARTMAKAAMLLARKAEEHFTGGGTAKSSLAKARKAIRAANKAAKAAQACRSGAARSQAADALTLASEVANACK